MSSTRLTILRLPLKPSSQIKTMALQFLIVSPQRTGEVSVALLTASWMSISPVVSFAQFDLYGCALRTSRPSKFYAICTRNCPICARATLTSRYARCFCSPACICCQICPVSRIAGQTRPQGRSVRSYRDFLRKYSSDILVGHRVVGHGPPLTKQ